MTTSSSSSSSSSSLHQRNHDTVTMPLTSRIPNNNKNNNQTKRYLLLQKHSYERSNTWRDGSSCSSSIDFDKPCNNANDDDHDDTDDDAGNMTTIIAKNMHQIQQQSLGKNERRRRIRRRFKSKLLISLLIGWWWWKFFHSLFLTTPLVSTKSTFHSNRYVDTKTPQHLDEETQQQQQPPPKFAYVFFLGACDPSHPWYRGMLFNILVASSILQEDITTATFPTTFRATNDNSKHNKHGINPNYQINKAPPTRTKNITSHFTVPDIIVLVQMDTETSAKRLPITDELLLQRRGVQIRYVPKILPYDNVTATTATDRSNFHTLILEKVLHVFDLVEYTRVLFLDGDVFPYCRLDYLMELSTVSSLTTTPQQQEKQSQQGKQSSSSSSFAKILRPNVLHAMYDDPVNGGVFVIEPRVGMRQELERLIQDQYQRLSSSASSYTTQLSWGPTSQYDDWLLSQSPYQLWHNNDHNDGTVTSTVKGTKWNFYCAHSDQGLLYYYLKFVLQDVSIIVGNTIEHYTPSFSSSSTTASTSRTPRDRGMTGTEPPRHLIPVKTVTPNYLDQFSCLPRHNEILMYNRNSGGKDPDNKRDAMDTSKVHDLKSSITSTNQQEQLRRHQLPFYHTPPLYPTRAASLGFYRDFHHAVGYGKLWEQKPPPSNHKQQEQMSSLNSVSDYWFEVLRHVLRSLQLENDPKAIQSQQRRQNPSLPTQTTTSASFGSSVQTQRQQPQQNQAISTEEMIFRTMIQSILASIDDGSFRTRWIGSPTKAVGRGDLFVTV